MVLSCFVNVLMGFKQVCKCGLEIISFSLYISGALSAVQWKHQRSHTVQKVPVVVRPEGSKEREQPDPRGCEGHRAVPQRHASLRVSRKRRRNGDGRSWSRLQRWQPHLPGVQSGWGKRDAHPRCTVCHSNLVLYDSYVSLIQLSSLQFHKFTFSFTQGIS